MAGAPEPNRLRAVAAVVDAVVVGLDSELPKVDAVELAARPKPPKPPPLLPAGVGAGWVVVEPNTAAGAGAVDVTEGVALPNVRLRGAAGFAAEAVVGGFGLNIEGAGVELA